MSGDGGVYGIGDVVERTGVAEGTLRMWERRYGFPKPARLASGGSRIRTATRISTRQRNSLPSKKLKNQSTRRQF